MGWLYALRWLFVARLSLETADVRFRAAIGHRECAKRIIACTGSIMAKQA